MTFPIGRELTGLEGERALGFAHRVIAKHGGLKEYSILFTDKRSIFILQSRTRSGWMLRMETWFGSAVITDTRPKTMEDYAGANLDALGDDANNLAIHYGSVTELKVSVGRMYPVYRFEMHYDEPKGSEQLGFYPVPLGIYMRDRRLERAREVILRQYAEEVLSTCKQVLPAEVIHDDAAFGS